MSEPKSAPPDPAKASHYVVLHMLDHHAPGTVVEAVDEPDDEAGQRKFANEYPTRAVVRRSTVPRLLSLNAVRPATEGEAKATAVELPAGVGQAPRVGDSMTIKRSDLDAMRNRILELEAAHRTGSADADEVKRLRARVQELEDPGKVRGKDKG